MCAFVFLSVLSICTGSPRRGSCDICRGVGLDRRTAGLPRARAERMKDKVRVWATETEAHTHTHTHTDRQESKKRKTEAPLTDKGVKDETNK